MQNNLSERFNVSYVTGSHSLKTGVWVQQWPNFMQFFVNGGMLLQYRNSRAPRRSCSTPRLSTRTRMAYNTGVYGQDQWTMKRLTLNLGLRYDSYRGYADAVDAPAGPWVPARHFDRPAT